jgi:TRAP-type C4-dicarboxylate transport system permease small subunit
MKGFWKFFDRLSDIMAALGGVLLVFISAAMCYTIFLRFVFRRTTIWITPMSEYALLWIVFLGTTWLLREGGHITTDVIYVHLNQKTKHYLDLIMSIIGGLACAMLFSFGVMHMYDCIIHGVTDVRAVTVPKSAIFIIIPLGSILLTVQFFRIAWSRLIDIRAGR